MINGGGGALFTIHDKTSGAVITGPTNLDSLGSGNCSNGFGDPVVLYDRDADRWMLSEFSSSGNRLCVYVSLTSDPIGGGWCNYDFTATNFPDYPKYAAWPDAYYVGSNENSPAAYAFDRANMLTCTTARPIQRFTAPQLGGFGFQALTPSDLDGTDLPPAGSPAYFLRHNDDEAHGGSTPGQDFLQIFEFDVDTATTRRSTSIPRTTARSGSPASTTPAAAGRRASASSASTAVAVVAATRFRAPTSIASRLAAGRVARCRLVSSSPTPATTATPRPSPSTLPTTCCRSSTIARRSRCQERRSVATPSASPIRQAVSLMLSSTAPSAH